MKLGHVTMRILVILGFFVLAGCHHVEPVRNFTDPPIPANASKLSLGEIGTQIKAAGIPHHWSFTDTGPGKMIGTLNRRGADLAKVEIVYSQTSYSITLVSSERLNQSGDEISSRYNGWAQNLNAAIQRQLINAG